MKSIKLFCVAIIFMILLIGITSAAEFDNKITYSNKDMKVDFDNLWGFGKHFGSIELKSHGSIDETKKVYVGKQIVMWYDINFNDKYDEGLGEVEFTDMNTGEIVEREWRYVYWGEEDYQEPIYSCSNFDNKNGTIDTTCLQTGSKTKTRKAWLPYNSKDIPKGKIRIGIEVEVKWFDYIDGVWNIVGKDVDKHITWGNLAPSQANWKVFNTTGADTWTVPTGVTNVTVLIVAGGGGGAGDSWGPVGGGGGGAGGLVYNISTSVTPLASINLFVGAGGTGGVPGTGTNGEYSFFGTTNTTGGGAAAASGANGNDGGSGGGASGDGSSRTGGTGIASQGTAGGDALTAGSPYAGGGGGGKSTAGADGTGSQSGNGGNGLEIWGITWAGGGGGGTSDSGSSPGTGGTGGGGNGGTTGAVGEASTGSGGGGGSDGGGNGASGVVIVAWENPPDPAPIVTNTFPSNTTTFTDRNIITFNGTASDNSGLINVSLYLDGTIISTNSSGFNATNYIFTSGALSEGNHDWFYSAWDDTSTPPSQTNGTGMRFTIDTIPTINTFSPTNNSYSSSTIFFNATANKNIGTWIVNYNGTNNTLSSINSSLEVEDGFHHLLVYGSHSASGLFGLNDTIYFTVDSSAPTLNVTAPFNLINYHKTGNNISLRWNISDDNIDTCRQNYNGTNHTLNCATNTTIIQNVNNISNLELTFYSNDTFGNSNNQEVVWNWSVWENERGVRNATIEGATESYFLDFIIQTGSLSTVKLWYDGNDTISPFSVISGRNYNATISDKIVQGVDSNKVVDVFWQVNFGSVEANTTTSTQFIRAFALDDCTSNSIVLYNFTIADEETKTTIPITSNTLARLNLQVFSYATTTSVLDFNSTYSAINSFSVCINSSLTSERYSNDLQIQYSADAYASELYHIQNETLDLNTFNQNITLYDLNSSDVQVFKIIFRDGSFLPVENALMKISRKYIDENLFREVEIPKTDARGEVIAHLVLDDVIYKFDVVKFGTVLKTFANVIAVCQTPLVQECEIDLNSFSESLVVPDFEEAENFQFTLGYDNETRVISSVFNIPDGSVQLITLNVTQQDSLGTAVCTDSLTSSSGTLSCVVPTNFGNSTITGKLYLNGNLQAFGDIKIDQDPSQIYGVTLTVLALFIMLTLIGSGVSNNPIFTVIFLLIGVVLLFSLNLVANNGFIGAGATILWLVIAIILIGIKGARSN